MTTNQKHENAYQIVSQSPRSPIIPSFMPNSIFDTCSSATAVQSPSTIPLPPEQSLKPSKKQRHIKDEYKKSLKDENSLLKKRIKELELQIFTKEAENTALQNQLRFFQQHMPDSAENDENSGHPDHFNIEDK